MNRTRIWGIWFRLDLSDKLTGMTTDEQIAWLTGKLDQVVAELMQTQEELRLTKGELQTTQETLQTTRAELQSTQEALGAAQVRIAELEKGQTSPPTFVKANKKKPQTEEKKPRKKRERQYNRARKRSVPTQIVLPPHRGLSGLSSALRRPESGPLP
jgi:chromosome segregation ATPase